MTTKAQFQEQETALETLKEWLKPGDTVYCILRHVSASGMSRSISPIISREDGIVDLSYWASRVTGYKVDQNNGGLKVQGAGMDMGFHLVYGLSSDLFPDGFECSGPKCPSNDHSNGDRDYSPHLHRDGGYALNHRWI